MAGFGFDEAQEMFRREVRDFAQKEIAPGAKERAKTEQKPQEMLKKVVDAGLVGLPIPEKYGGQGADWVTTGIAIEELAKVDVTVSLLSQAPFLAYFAMTHGLGDIMEDWVRDTMKGERISGFAITEPEAGADAAGIRMTAIRDGDFYILNGEKTSITMAIYADAMLLFAKTDPKSRIKGISCFWVPLDLPGVTRSSLVHTGLKPMGNGSLFMDNVRLPAKYRVGEEGRGFYLFGEAVNYQRVWLSLMALGVAQASLEETMAYTKQRVAFGQPVAKFEGVSFKMAEHATRIEAARMLCYYALSLADQKIPIAKEAAMVKWWCPVLTFDCVHDCLLLHGHIGYSEEYPLEQRLRDVIGLEFTDSLPSLMKIIVARELMGRDAATL